MKTVAQLMHPDGIARLKAAAQAFKRACDNLSKEAGRVNFTRAAAGIAPSPQVQALCARQRRIELARLRRKHLGL